VGRSISAKDLVYFLADGGTLVGDDVSVLADATDEVVYRFGRVATLVDQRPTPARRSTAELGARQLARLASAADDYRDRCPLS
jgi:hypothetical protein